MSARGSRAAAYAGSANPGKNKQFNRRWREPRQIATNIEKTTTTLKAISRLLTLAMEATSDEHEILFKEADKLREAADLNWTDVLWREVA